MGQHLLTHDQLLSKEGLP